ncbi:MAG: hypothetical protein ACSHYF_05760 [Verrucomicrobiaceae bacterium]
MSKTALCGLTISSVYAIDIVDEFDGSELDTAVWESAGPKTASVTGGRLLMNDDGGDWGRYDIKSQQRFFLPEPGQTTTVEWVIGTSTVTNDIGQSIRYQIGLDSNNEPDDNPEHYWNSTGGIWIDLDVINPADTANVSGSARYADDTKNAGGEAFNLGGVDIAWNWLTESRTLRLEFTDTQYTWYDGTTELYTHTWADAGIDAEFQNGFRIIAMGMNFNNGSGTMSFEKISVTNGQGPSGLITGFSAAKNPVRAGEKFDLEWIVDSGATAVSIDQEIGDVTAQTTAGTGSVTVTAPEVEATTQVIYTITVSKTGEADNVRQLVVNVQPAPPLSEANFFDDFDTDFLNEENWRHIGNKTYSIADSLVTWGNDGGDWGHGEVVTKNVFPIPPAGSPTTITWNLGPADIEVENDADTALRPMMGIASAFEQQTYSLQAWQNTTGGIWLDVATMGASRLDGVSAIAYHANDSKAADTNPIDAVNVDISDWDWKNDNQEFSLVLTNLGYTWYAGENQLHSATYAEAGLDDEFSKGFYVLFSAINWSIGRGPVSLDSLNISNGGSPSSGPVTISEIILDASNMVSLTWNSEPGATYRIESSSDLEFWLEEIDGVDSDATTKTFTFASSGAARFYRVIKE